MRPEPRPVAARPLARHSALLIRRAPERETAVDPAADPAADTHGPALVLAAQRIARALPQRLSRLLGGESPIVAAVAPRTATVADLAAIAGPLAGNSLFAGGGEMRFVASIQATALLRLLDRAFGGTGDLPDPMPTVLPLSALLLVERVEAVIADVLAAALDLSGDAVPAALRRDGELAQVLPFAPDAPLRLFGFDIAAAGAKPWRLTLAFAEASLGPLFGFRTASAVGRETRPARLIADPAAAPFADLPLPLTARLVDMAMPLARLSRLRVGDVLPVAVARSVPLHLGGRTIARGSIGAMDDLVAVQLTEAFR